ncbi:MAG: hypothetical protein GXX94_08175 [Chloroflexi bacterium]|nr:hypothetical protein [Chloroflexota bacterium]
MPLDWLRHVLSASYLYALRPAADQGTGGGWFLGAALLLLASAALLWQVHAGCSRASSRSASLVLGATLAGGVGLVAQRYAGGPLSARIWTFSCIAIALAVPALAWLQGLDWPTSLRRYVQALACTLSPEDPPPPWTRSIASLGAHALTLTGLTRLAAGQGGRPSGLPAYPLPLIAALCAAVCLMAIAAAARRSGRSPNLRTEILAPLAVPYMAILLQWAVGDLLGVDTAPYQAYSYPDLWSPWFHDGIPWAIGITWMILSAAALLCETWRPARRWVLAGAVGGMVTWAFALYARHLSHGATGSDPFAYLQMAADLATTGDLRHGFPLAALVEPQGLALWPLVPEGYNPPLGGLAATVWPPGWPAMLAPLYALGGEGLARWGAPAALLACAGATAWLTRSTLAPRPIEGPGHSTPWALGAATLVLTSYEAVSRALVPMADAAAALFTLVMLLSLVQANRRDDLRLSACAGLALALAYDVRHPQLVLGLAAVPALALGPWPWRRRIIHAAAFGVAALAGAIPDLWYHAVAFGSPWISESSEWFLLSPANIQTTLAALWRGDLFRRNEFGYLWPLIALGLVASLRTRHERRATVILLTGGAAMLLFHLCYAALRLRDLIPLFPLLAMWAICGALALVRNTPHTPGNALHRVVAIGLILTLLMARTAETLALPLRARLETYGYLDALERESYIRLGERLPPEAVVAAGPSAGAVQRYAGRDIIRPAVWSPDDFDRLYDALQEHQRPLYLLEDGEEMSLWLESLEREYAIKTAESWPLPRYGKGGQPLDGPASLYTIVIP